MRVFFTVVFAFFIAISASAQHQWVPLDGPTGGEFKGIYISPTGTLYATIIKGLTCGRALIRSRDEGKTWELLANTPHYFDYPNHHIAFNFDINGNCLLSLNSTVYISTDDGTSWNYLRDSNATRFIGVGKQNEYFVLTDSGTVWRTTTAGKEWSNITSSFAGLSMGMTAKELTKIYWIKDDHYYCECGYSFITHDNFATVIQTDYFNTPLLTSQVFGKRSDGIFLGLRADGKILMGDFFHTVREIGEMPPSLLNNGPAKPSLCANTLTGISDGEPTLFGFMEPTLYYLDTTAQEMVSLHSMPPLSLQRQVGSEDWVTVSTTGTIFYCNGEAIYKTNDLGVSWKELPVPYDNVNYIQTDYYGRIFTKRLDPWNAYSWLQVSENQGKSWRRISPVGHAYNGMLGAGYDGGIITTVRDSICDYGINLYYFGGLETSSWTELTRVGGAAPGYNLLVDSSDNVLFNDNGSFYKSDDNGISWDGITNPGGVTVTFSPLWKMYTTDGQAIYASSDNGTTWVKSKVGIRDLYIEKILVPTEGTIFFTTREKGVFRSTDDGMSWAAFTGPWGDSVTSLAYTDGSLFLGTASRGLFSTDLNGKNPVSEPLSLLTGHILTLFVDRTKTLFVGAECSPVWVMHPNASSVRFIDRSTSDFSVGIISSYNNQSLKIDCSKATRIQVQLFDALGREHQHFLSKEYGSGNYLLPLEMKNCSSGVYFIKATSETESKTVSFIH